MKIAYFSLIWGIIKGNIIIIIIKITNFLFFQIHKIIFIVKILLTF